MLTVATEVLDEVQTTDCRTCVLESLKVPVATKDCDTPLRSVGVAGETEMDTRLGILRAGGMYSSALESAEPAFWPPTIRTAPSGKSVAVCAFRATFKPPVCVKVPPLGSYTSALGNVTGPLPLLPTPPSSSTVPLSSNVEVPFHRPVFKLPVALKAAVEEL